jgi:HSP20 family protein
MRREVDELFGDVFDRGMGGRPRGQRGGFAPAVDVFYVGDPPRAVVHAELPGVDQRDVTVDIVGRDLVLAGRRRPPQADGRLYQQVEIPHGVFRRVIPLGADVVAEEARAEFNDGILEIVLPLARNEAPGRRVPIEGGGDEQ